MSFFYGASDEARTRYLHLGKVALYQMSYTRNDRDYYSHPVARCQELIWIFFDILSVLRAGLLWFLGPVVAQIGQLILGIEGDAG